MKTKNFIEQLYNRYLVREADEAGVDYWQQQIDSRVMTAADVTEHFIHSTEFVQNFAPIIELYYTTFGRIPDLSGLAHWVSLRDAGASMDDIEDGFLKSVEFEERFNETVDNTAFLQKVYQNVFHRPADEEGLAFWKALLEGGLSRTALVDTISESAEFKAVHQDNLKVLLEYYGTMGTHPSEEELHAALNEDDFHALLTRLYAADEYTGKAAPYLIKNGTVVSHDAVKGSTVFI
ncbi:MAG: DUF4214 domain-containing protein, partial [Methylococcales bacterium]|nr:DUF4214 domain-containing protein [Methylococcales bacterium]